MNEKLKKERIEAIKSLNVEKMQELIGIDSIWVVETRSDMNEFISYFSVGDFAGLFGSDDCVLTPGNIGEVVDIGDLHIYISRGANGFVGHNLASFVATLANCSIKDAVNFIKNVYRILIRDEGEADEVEQKNNRRFEEFKQFEEPDDML